MIPREQVCQGMVTSAEPESAGEGEGSLRRGSGLSARGPLEPEACLSSQVHELLSLCPICSQWDKRKVWWEQPMSPRVSISGLRAQADQLWKPNCWLE